MEQDEEVRALFQGAREGDAEAREKLYGLLYEELRAMAGRKMSSQRPDHTLQATALVNEAYLRLCRDDRGRDDERFGVHGREHFFRLASRVMRQVLVDHARKRLAEKRSAAGERVDLDHLVHEYDRRAGGLLELDAALERMQVRNPELVKLVELRFFGGRSMSEIAEVLNVSERQAARLWSAARLFLKDQLQQVDE